MRNSFTPYGQALTLSSLIFFYLLANMKSLILLMSLAIATISTSQMTTKNVVWTCKYNLNEFTLTQIQLEGSEPYLVWAYDFDNVEYQHISDYGSVSFKSKSEVENFIRKLSEFANETSSGEITFQDDRYILRSTFYGSPKAFTLIDNEGKWTGFNKKQFLKKILPQLRSSLELME